MRPVTQCKWHTEGTSKEVGHPEKRHQQPRKAHWGDPAACRLQHYNFGKASVSRHHPPSDEKRHTPSLYFISYPKSKWQDTLLVPKPAPNYTDLLQPCGAAENSPHTGERHHPFSSETWSAFLFNYGGHRHAPPWSGWRGRWTLPQDFAAQALRWAHSTISWGKKSWFRPTAFQPPLAWNKTLLVHVQVWLIPTETAGRRLCD